LVTVADSLQRVWVWVWVRVFSPLFSLLSTPSPQIETASLCISTSLSICFICSFSTFKLSKSQHQLQLQRHHSKHRECYRALRWTVKRECEKNESESGLEKSSKEVHFRFASKCIWTWVITKNYNIRRQKQSCKCESLLKNF